MKAWQRLAVSLVVGIHPLAWLIVGSIPYRQESLVLLFTMLTVIGHAQTRLGHTRWTILTAVSAFLAFASKETAIFFIPAFIAVWEFSERSKKRSRILFAGEITAAVAYVLLRFHAVPDLWRAQSPPLPWDQAIGTRFFLFDRFLMQLASPFLPTVSDAVPRVGLFSPWSAGGIIILLLLLIAILRYGFRSPEARVIILGLVTVLPALNLVPVPRIGSPHYAYHAVVFAAVAAVLFIDAPKTRRLRSIVAGAAIIWNLIAAVTTVTGGFRHRDDMTFFSAEVRRDPQFAEGYYYLGISYLARREYDRAGDNFGAALATRPGYLYYLDSVSATINLAGVRTMQGRYDEADSLYTRAIRQAPESLLPYLVYNRALIAFDRGRYDAVVTQLQDSPSALKQPKAIFLYADALRRIGKIDEYIKALQ